MTQNAINNTGSIIAIDNITIDGNTISSTDTNGDIVIAPDGSGTVSVTTAPIVPTGDRADSLGSATNSWDNVYAAGLTFDDGTNVLANFVDSTAWTPVLNFGGATTGITYGVQSGTYARIGPILFFRLYITLTSKGSATGAATITGLPTVSGDASATSFSLSAVGVLTSNTAEYTNFNGTIGAAASVIDLQQSPIDGNSISTLSDTNFAATTTILTEGFYFV